MKAALCAAFLFITRVGMAQEFAPASPLPISHSVLAPIHTGLSRSPGNASIEAITTRWWGLSALDANALALGGSLRDVVVSVGIAHFGEAELGWNALGVALGSCKPRAGGAVMAVARQDRDRSASTSVEAGGGAWTMLGPARVFVSAPQLWRDGAAPPLERALETGVQIDSRSSELWLAFAAAPTPDAAADRRVGLRLRTDGFALWAEALAPPWRARAGVDVTRGPLGLAASFEGHPMLGETTHLSLRLGAPMLPR